MIETGVASGRSFLSVLMVWMRVMCEIKKTLVQVSKSQESRNIYSRLLHCFVDAKQGEGVTKRSRKVSYSTPAMGHLLTPSCTSKAAKKPVTKTKHQINRTGACCSIASANTGTYVKIKVRT